jgi:hypothetical protein
VLKEGETLTVFADAKVVATSFSPGSARVPAYRTKGYEFLDYVYYFEPIFYLPKVKGSVRLCIRDPL